MKKYAKILETWLFPAILFFYPLLKINQGIDLTDTCYGLVTYHFFPQGGQDWTVATWLANVAGSLLMQLPGGETMLGMRFYTGLFVSAMALLSYYFLKGKMPAWLAFWGEVIAIGLCWIPTTSLYNYLTFFLFLCGSISLYRGLIWQRRSLMALAGVFLGASVLTRLPNILECGLILAVFYYGILKKKPWKEIWTDVLFCVGGFFAAFLAGFVCIGLQFGFDAYGQMLAGLSGYQATDATYSPLSMIASVLAAYKTSATWVCWILIVGLACRILYGLWPGRLQKLKLAASLLAFGLLLRLLWGRGMFSFNYHFYWSVFQWFMVLLYAAIGLAIWGLTDSKVFRRDKLLLVFVLLIIVITPIGSNNETYPNMNNLFLAAPTALWMGYRLWLKLSAQEKQIPWKIMLAVAAGMITVQSLGFGIKSSFRDSLEGQPRDAQVRDCAALAGMYTNAENAAAIQDVVDYCNEIPVDVQRKQGRQLLTMGDVPGFSWIFDLPGALSHDWPDMDTYPSAQMKLELLQLQKSDGLQPLVITGSRPTEGISVNEQEKWMLLDTFLQENGYTAVLDNGVYQIYDLLQEKGDIKTNEPE